MLDAKRRTYTNNKKPDKLQERKRKSQRKKHTHTHTPTKKDVRFECGSYWVPLKRFFVQG